MLKREDFFMIIEMKEKGMHVTDIADTLGVHPRMVRRALARGGAPRGRKRNRVGKLEPFKTEIDRLLGEGVWNAMVIFREIQEKGYPGSVITLRRYIAPKRVLRSSRRTVRFETEPGKQLQNDWGEIWTRIGGVRGGDGGDIEGADEKDCETDDGVVPNPGELKKRSLISKLLHANVMRIETFTREFCKKLQNNFVNPGNEWEFLQFNFGSHTTFHPGGFRNAVEAFQWTTALDLQSG